MPTGASSVITSEDKYYALKDKLEALNYLQPLGIESAPLVEKLLSDLILTTESYRNLERAANKQGQSLNLLQGQLQPLRGENSRLVRENNQLHQEMIRRAEEFELREQAWEQEANRSKGQAKDAKFLRSTDADRILKQQKEISELRSRISQLLERNMVATSTGHGGGKKKNAMVREWQGRRQEIAMSSSLPPSDSSSREASGQSAAEDPGGIPASEAVPTDFAVSNRERQLAERLKAQSTESQLLREELNALKTSAVNAKITRDQEISRLSKLLEQGRPLDEEGAKLAHDANLKLIEQLQDQIDYLNGQLVKKTEQTRQAEAKVQAVKRLEITIRQGERKVANLELQKSALEDRLAETLALNKTQEDALASLNSFHSVNMQTKDGALHVVERQKQYQEQMDRDIAALKGRLEEVLRENDGLRAENERAKEQLKNVVSSVDSEVRQNTQTQSLLANLQGERDMLKKEINSLSDLLKASRDKEAEALKECDLARAAHEKEQMRTQSLRDEMRLATAAIAEKTSENRKLREQARQPRPLPKIVEDIRDELNRTREQCTVAELARDKACRKEARGVELNQRLTLEIEKLEMSLAKANEAKEMARRAMVAADSRAEAMESQARTAAADRDEAVRGYGQFNADLQARIEADHQRQIQLQEMQDDLDEAREAAMQARRQAQRAQAQESDTRRRLERAVHELEQAQAVATGSEKAAKRLTAQVAGLEQKLTLSENNERRVSEELSNVTRQLQSVEAELQSVDNDRGDARQEAHRLGALIIHAEGTRVQMEERLRDAHKEAEKAARLTEQARNETRLREAEIASGKKKALKLEGIVEELDAKCDTLSNELDENAEKTARLMRDLDEKESHLSDLNSKLAQLQRQVESSTKALQGKDREAQTAKVQLAELTSRYVEQGNAIELRDAEAKAMMSDLANMTRENQAVNEGAGNVKRENTALRQELADAVHRCEHVEGLCRKQEKEREDVTRAYRAACEERARLEQNIAELSAQRATMTLRLQEAGNEMNELRARLREGDFGTQAWRSAKSNYERQLAELGAANEALTTRLRRMERVGGAYASSMDEARDATAALAATQNGLRYDNAQLRALADEARNRIEQLQATNETLRASLDTAERKKIVFEEALADARSSLAKALSADPSRAETAKMEAQLFESAKRIEDLTYEISSLKRENAKLSQLLDESKKDVEEQERRAMKLRSMAERYERELDEHGRVRDEGKRGGELSAEEEEYV